MRVGVKHGVVLLVFPKGKEPLLLLSGVGEKRQGLVRVAGQHHFVEVLFLAGSGSQLDPQEPPLHPHHRLAHADAGLEIFQDGLDVGMALPGRNLHWRHGPKPR